MSLSGTRLKVQREIAEIDPKLLPLLSQNQDFCSRISERDQMRLDCIKDQLF